MNREDKRPYSAIEFRPKGFENPIKTVKRWKANLICAYQRIRYGYCYRDVWSIDWWFLHIVPNMLLDLKETAHGFPSSLEGETGEKQWNAILEEMAFLFQEAREDTCQRKNPYEDAFDQKLKEFTEKYGIFGEKLKTEEEKKREKETGFIRHHSMDELPEYKEISDQYYEEARKLSGYRKECRDKGLKMFQEWFDNLWD